MSEMTYEMAQDDEIFEEWTENLEKAKKEAEAKKSSSNYTKPEYEDIQYVGLTKDHPTIIRLVGNFVEEDLRAKRPYSSDAKFLHISRVKSDDKKTTFYLQLPLRSDDPETDHLMWRIIDRIYQKQWIKDPATGKNKPVNIIESQHPDIFKLVNKGGFTEEDGKWPYLYAKGWRGTEMLLINCIDRRDDWCKTNKHTKLLSKSVNVTEDGKVYAEKGIPAFGFYDTLGNLRKNFKQGWEHYDLVITRTGENKDTKTNVYNGTAFTTPAAISAGLDKSMGIDESEYKYVSQEPGLTAEELSYQRYDLDKNFKVTSYHTINKYLSNSIKKIDAALNTHFYDDLQQLVKEEKEKWDQENKDAVKDAPVNVTASKVEESVQSTSTSEPTVTRTVQPEVSEGLSATKIALLKGYSELSEEQKSYIKDVAVKADGSLDHIVWTDNAPALLDCPLDQGGCGQLSPNSFTVCPVCGKHFA